MLQEVIKDLGPSSLLPYHPYHVAEPVEEINFLLCTLSLQTQSGYL